MNHQEQKMYLVQHLPMQRSKIFKILKFIFFCYFDSFRALDNVNDLAKAHFREAAEKILETRDAVDALSAALACISGTTNIVPRSLLTKKEVRLNIIFLIFLIIYFIY